MQPPRGLHRPPRGGGCRLGLPQRQLQKTAPGDEAASRCTHWCFQVDVASLLARTAEVFARSASPPRAAGPPEQPLRRARMPPQARAGGQGRRQRVQQCGWRAWSAQDRGRRPRGGREVARRRDRLSAVFRCPRGARGCDRWGAAAAQRDGCRRAGAGLGVVAGRARAGQSSAGAPQGPPWSPPRADLHACECFVVGDIIEVVSPVVVMSSGPSAFRRAR